MNTAQPWHCSHVDEAVSPWEGGSVVNLGNDTFHDDVDLLVWQRHNVRASEDTPPAMTPDMAVEAAQSNYRPCKYL